MRPARTPDPESGSDDLAPDLPPLDGGEPARDLALDDELDPGLDDAGGEPLGLDEGAGFDGDLGLLDDVEDAASTDDAGTTPDQEVAEGMLSPDDAELPGEESGWLDGAEAADVAGWDADLDEVPRLEEEFADRGAADETVEGVGEDDALLEGASIEPAGQRDDLATDLDLGADATLQTAEDEPAPADALTRRDDVRWRWLGPEDEAIGAIGGATGGAIAAGRRWYRLDDERLEPLRGDAAAAPEATSIVRTSGGWLVGLRSGGILRSRDGTHFEPVLPATHGDGSVELLAEVHAAGVRVWAVTGAGTLLRSDDEGRTWSAPQLPATVLAIAAAGAGVVALLGGASGPASLLWTADGGRSWRRTPGPPLERRPVAGAVRMAAYGSHVVVCEARGVPPSWSPDAAAGLWRPLETLRDTRRVAVVPEAAVPVLYAALYDEARGRGLVARMPLEGETSAQIVLDLEDVWRAHRPRSLAPVDARRIEALVACAEAEGTTLWVGSGLGLVRAVIPGASQ